MRKVSLVCALAFSFLMGAPLVAEAAAPAKKEAPAPKGREESLETVKQKLDEVGKKLVQGAARTVTPTKAAKAVAKDGKEFVASYVEVDASTMSTEVRPSTGPGGKYVGIIKYLENQYECRGATKDAALKAPCTMVKSRRMNELIRYDGKWTF